MAVRLAHCESAILVYLIRLQQSVLPIIKNDWLAIAIMEDTP